MQIHQLPTLLKFHMEKNMPPVKNVGLTWVDNHCSATTKYEFVGVSHTVTLIISLTSIAQSNTNAKSNTKQSSKTHLAMVYNIFLFVFKYKSPCLKFTRELNTLLKASCISGLLCFYEFNFSLLLSTNVCECQQNFVTKLGWISIPKCNLFSYTKIQFTIQVSAF